MKNPWIISLLVGLGGFAGSVARYGLSVASQRYSIEWPIGTLAANILGCLAIGIITGISSRGETLSPELRMALAVGFCGGFTTMSSMIYETAEMIRASEYLHATLYTVGTFLFSMTAFLAGIMTVRIFTRIGGRLWS
ncbi:MAG TPA: fluoride efflux transporter CrcB [Alphaproteobacteria bacterium]|nr:fluoride efflux transporter CrcB [Alphaproteobacteria bacterium]